MSSLKPNGLLASDLWTDRPDAPSLIEAGVASRRWSPDLAEKLAHFVEHGYLTLSIGLPTEGLRELDHSVERLWRERPGQVAFAYKSPLRPFSESDESLDRRPSYRIADLHSYSEAALGLYLHPRIFEAVSAIFGQPAVATQSLYFEYGSQQPLHRDPVHVYMTPPSHLVAAWIALEDIGPDCGPLRYVPCSHRLPYYQFEPGIHVYDHLRHGDAEAQAAEAFDVEQCRAAGFSEVSLECRRGEVLLWHHSLLHGGSTPRDPALTRKSFVVHFSTMENYECLDQMLVEQHRAGDGTLGRRERCYSTVKVLGRDGCYGFDNPLRHRGSRGSEQAKTALKPP